MHMAKPQTTKTKRKVQEEPPMIDEKKTQELLGQFTGKAVETMTVWADANQRVLREMVEFGAAGAKESVRLYAELQQSAIEALKDSQAAALRWQTAWQDGAKDPVQFCQKAVADSVDTAQKAFKVLEAGAQAVTRSAERLQTSAELAGKGIQETYTAVVAKMKDVYSQN
jgi:hypothetical protein